MRATFSKSVIDFINGDPRVSHKVGFNLLHISDIIDILSIMEKAKLIKAFLLMTLNIGQLIKNAVHESEGMIHLILEIKRDESEGLSGISSRRGGCVRGRVGWSRSSNVSNLGPSLEEICHTAGKLIRRHRLVSCGL